ncbi:ubiquitin-conjugating enzyme E2 28-like [Platysternon megacephalum]|uniref:Ubiquitin-conjugating enzyme E2 28-like n=1 Tax=Platysternon megacephalum TaxID=55544 RepID=A0A4D9DAU6_9SAUR|nr:ubiquitin-conjugating enzyme E2 28-like [Platysternon megacephalum]
MSPYAFYQYFLNVEDSKVIEYLKIFSERPRAEIEELAQSAAENPHRREAQRALADDVTRLVHSEGDRASAEAAGLAVFGRGDLLAIDSATMSALFDQLGGSTLESQDLTVVDALVSAGVVESRSAARRAIAEGGAYLNNNRIDDADCVLSDSDLLAGGYAMLRRGKRNVGLIRVNSSVHAH